MTDHQSGGRSHAVFAGAIPDEVANAYDRLAESGGVPEDQAAAYVGGERILRQLLDHGMAITPNAAGKVVAAPPRLAALGAASHAHQRLITIQRKVLDLTRAAYEADDRRPPGTAPDGMLDVYTDRDEIIAVSNTLINGTRREWRALDNLHRESYLTEGSRVDALESIRDSITRRCIYDRAFMRDPVGRRIIRDSTAAGEQARLYPNVQMKMQVCDTSAALLPCSLSGMSGAVLVRAEPIIRGLQQYFDLMWEAAVPADGPPAEKDPLTSRQREVIGLLAQGLRHGEIARQTGLSLSMVHKHAENICGQLNASSPFQAGIEAHRRGWVP